VTVDEVAKDIVDAAIKVHRALGPGLLESAYQARIDLRIDQLVLVENKTVERFFPSTLHSC
jgi:hypothetical protein